MAPSLHTLPTEMIEAIMQKASLSSLHMARLTCRGIEAATRRLFIKSFRSCLNIDLQTRTLEQVVQISKMPDIAAAITIIDIACHDDLESGPPFPWNEISGEYQAKTSPEICAEAGTLLALAFQKLRNIKILFFTEDRNPARTDPTDFDVWSSVAIVLGAIHACGIQLREISIFEGGLLDDISVLQVAQVLPSLEMLQLRFLGVKDGDGFVELCGRLLGMQLAQSMPRLNSLKELRIASHHSDYGPLLFHSIASCTPPTLLSMELFGCSINLSDLFYFLQRCCLTLRSFTCLFMPLDGRPEGWLRRTFCLVRDSMKLNRLMFTDARLSTGVLEFPGIDTACFRGICDEDDYIQVFRVKGVLFDGEDEVLWGVQQMLDHPALGSW